MVNKQFLNVDLNVTRESLSRTDAGREFCDDGAALLKAHLPYVYTVRWAQNTCLDIS